MAWTWRRRRRWRRSGRAHVSLQARPYKRRIRDLRPAEADRVPSPGGWIVPPGVLPAWNWIPPPGITPRPDRAPYWVRCWYYTPVIDRYAYAWMWRHGAWDVIPHESAGRTRPLGIPPPD